MFPVTVIKTRPTIKARQCSRSGCTDGHHQQNVHHQATHLHQQHTVLSPIPTARRTARRCGQAAYVNVCKLCEVDT